MWLDVTSRHPHTDGGGGGRYVPFVNRPFESEIHGTVNFTNFCFVLLVTWRHRLRFLCHLEMS